MCTIYDVNTTKCYLLKYHLIVEMIVAVRLRDRRLLLVLKKAVTAVFADTETISICDFRFASRCAHECL